MNGSLSVNPEDVLLAIAKPKSKVENQLRQGGEIGRRARLRIAKSSISERRFSFQSERVLRMENRFFVRNRRGREC
jgi:hypothetical protein